MLLLRQHSQVNQSVNQYFLKEDTELKVTVFGIKWEAAKCQISPPRLY